MLLKSMRTPATSLVQFLISGYFINLRSVLVVYNSTDHSALRLKYLDAVQQTFQQQGNDNANFGGLQWLNVATLNDDNELGEKMLHAVNIATQGFITILPNTTKFLHARYYATRMAEQRLKDKYHLFLCEDENPQDLLRQEILQFYPHHLMVTPGSPSMDITATTEKRTDHDRHQNIRLELWTQKFVGDSGNLDAVQLDSFEPNETFVNNVELYPNKFSNLEGRSLRLAAITYKPYAVTNYVAAGEGNVDPINPKEPKRSIACGGSEANLMKTFCDVYHCHLRVAAHGVENWGTIYENGTSTGLFGDIFEQRVEMAVGGIYNWYNDITETSDVIAYSQITLLGPAPTLSPAWRTNLMPFTNNLWFLLIVTMIICAIILRAIEFSALAIKNRLLSSGGDGGPQHYGTFEQAVLEIFAVFVQQSIAERCIRSFGARFFMTALLMATITLENTYSGQLKSILTVPSYTEPVDTMQKWSKAPWKWGGTTDLWVAPVKESDILVEQILVEKFEVRDHDSLYNATFRNDYGIGIERLTSGAFSIASYVTAPALETKILIKDPLYSDWTRTVSIRGWPLMPLVNRHLHACMESGLYLHWERQAVSEYSDHQTHEMLMALAAGSTPKPPPQKLTLENVSGAMFVLLFGHLIAFAAFMCELLAGFIKMKISIIRK